MPYQEGDTTYNYATGQASTLQRGSDGILKWSDPVQIPGNSPSGKMAAPPGPSVGVGEDMAKTAGPALERAVVGLGTAPTTLGSGIAWGVGKGADYLPESVGPSVQKGAQATQDFLKPFTYPQVQGKIESAYNQTHPNDPFYYPQTGPGQFEEAAIGGGVAAAGGPISIAKALTGPLAKIGGRLATGVGAGLGSEAAGQIADTADLGPGVGEGARAAGAIIGGREAAERPRKTITPYPATSQAHTDMANLLKQQPGDITTAGQATGNPNLLQKEGNLAPHAPAPYNNLGVTQPKADTTTMLGTAAIDPATAAQGASRPLIKKAKDEIGLRLDDLASNTMSKYDPEFKQDLKDITNEYYRIKNTSPNPVTPTPIDKRMDQIYASGPKSTKAGMTGSEFAQLHEDIGKEAVGFTKSDPVTGGALAKIRDALAANMERSQAGTPYEGKWGEAFTQYESAKTLEKATKQRPPAAGVLDPNTVSNSSRNPDSQLAELARAQATVHKPLPLPSAPSGTIPAMVGALVSHLYGGSPAEGSIAGHISGPDVEKSLFRNPVTAGIHFSPWNQARVSNQMWQPGPGSTLDPKTVARLLALSKTERTAPQEQ